MGFRDRWWHQATALKQEVYALYLACRDPRVPWHAKALAAGVVAYALSPIDLIPDFIPVLGYLDDLVLIPLGVLMVRALIPGAVLGECRRRAALELSEGTPRSRAGLAIVVTIWISLAVLGVWGQAHGAAAASEWAMTIKRTTAKKRKRTKKPASFSDVQSTAAPGKKRLPRPKVNPRLKRSRLCAALTFFGLLALATSAGANCAWVLWQHSLAQGQQYGSWQRLIVEESRSECAKQMKARGQGFKTWETDRGIAYVQEIQGRTYSISLNCLPDSLDPRGPKAR